jgi:heme-degrading monooxygenase HmoA
MFARLTQFDVDTVAISLEAALNRFRELILPDLKRQPGYAGASLMRTAAGKGVLITYWTTPEAAQAGVESGFYAKQIEKFLTFYRQPPGREHYEVVFMEQPVLADA